MIQEHNNIELSRDLVIEYQTILQEDYGKRLSYEEAEKGAQELIGYFSLGKMSYL